MIGFRFTQYLPDNDSASPFEQLFKLFKELLLYTSGNAAEALSWLTELDRQHQLTKGNYGIGDFIRDLKEKGYLEEKPGKGGTMKITPKTEQTLRKSSLEEIFGKLKKSKSGQHNTKKPGLGTEPGGDLRNYEFGDPLDNIAFTESFKNAQINHGADNFMLTSDDLVLHEHEYTTQTATVLMIDISHSMILYGEDRITPAKKVAMGLAELIKMKYPKDTLDILVFGNDAWQIQVKDLPYLEVGPYHTNTVAGLDLALDLLRRRKTVNKQIIMITDGKPTCIKIGGEYYKNSMGLDRKITNKCFNLARHCRKLKIPITTFMIAQDPYLKRFVREFTEINNGKAYYSSIYGLGEFVFEDFERNKKKFLR